jgi:hypothetical protein
MSIILSNHEVVPGIFSDEPASRCALDIFAKWLTIQPVPGSAESLNLKARLYAVG